MSNPTPSPRPAALVTAMGEAIAERLKMQDSGSQRWPPAGVRWDVDLANESISAASAHGFVLIPRAELEEAADLMENSTEAGLGPRGREIANRLRQRSRG